MIFAATRLKRAAVLRANPALVSFIASAFHRLIGTPSGVGCGARAFFLGDGARADVGVDVACRVQGDPSSVAVE